MPVGTGAKSKIAQGSAGKGGLRHVDFAAHDRPGGAHGARRDFEAGAAALAGEQHVDLAARVLNPDGAGVGGIG